MTRSSASALRAEYLEMRARGLALQLRLARLGMRPSPAAMSGPMVTSGATGPDGLRLVRHGIGRVLRVS